MAVLMSISQYIGGPSCSLGFRMHCFGQAARVNRDNVNSLFRKEKRHQHGCFGGGW